MRVSSWSNRFRRMKVARTGPTLTSRASTLSSHSFVSTGSRSSGATRQCAARSWRFVMRYHLIAETLAGGSVSNLNIGYLKNKMLTEHTLVEYHAAPTLGHDGLADPLRVAGQRAHRQHRPREESTAVALPM